MIVDRPGSGAADAGALSKITVFFAEIFDRPDPGLALRSHAAAAHATAAA